jgi:polysaccharide pyruvyl transferase CsaB
MANYKIVISGYYGFNNAGDEAMLSAILQALQGTFDSPDITVISGNPKSTAESFGVHTVPRFSISGICRSIFASDLIISGGGSLLQDVTSWKSMIYYLSIITLGVLFRKQVFLYSQGIGPVRYRVIRIILKHVLNHVDAITVRDKESKGFLERLGVRRKIYTTADAVLSLSPADLSIGRKILKEKGIPEGKKKIGLAIRYWHNSREWMEQLKKTVHRLAEEEDAVIICIPMQFPEDENAAEAMGCGDDRIFFLNDDYSIGELMSIIGNMDVLLGMRLHALIFSALMHVPFLGISYDPKIDNFLALIGQKASTSVQHMDGEKLYNDTCRILSSGLDEKDWEKVDALRERACENVQILKSLVTHKEENP